MIAGVMRRSVVVLASSTLAVLFSVLGACASSEGREPRARADGGAPVDASFGREEAAPPAPPGELPAGDVCGDTSGLDPAASWPARGGCPTRAGRSSLLGPQNASIRWREPAAAAEGSSPVVSATGTVWVGTAEGDVLALAPNGAVRFTFRTGGPVRSSPVIDARGNVIVGSSDGTLYAFAERAAQAGDATDDAGADGGGDAGADAGADGDAGGDPEPEIVFALPVGPITSSPVIGADGTIYVAAGGALLAVRGDGSGVKWSATTNDDHGSSPAIGQNGTAYVGSSDGKLYAIAPDGETTWALDLGAPIDASPAIGGDGAVYIGAVDGALHAVDPSGDRRWTYRAEGAIRETPAVYAGVVYVGAEDQRLHAVSTIDGSRRWAYETLGAVATPVIGPDDVVYVGASDARLYALTPKGALLFAVNLRGRAAGAPAIAQGSMLYVATDTGLVAVGP